MAKLTEAQFKALEIVSEHKTIHHASYQFRIGRGRNLWKSLDVLENRAYVTYDGGFYAITPAGHEALAAERERRERLNAAAFAKFYAGEERVTLEKEPAQPVTAAPADAPEASENLTSAPVDTESDMATWREYVNRETPVTSCACCVTNAAQPDDIYCANCRAFLAPFQAEVDKTVNAANEEIHSMQVSDSILTSEITLLNAERDALKAEVERLEWALQLTVDEIKQAGVEIDTLKAIIEKRDLEIERHIQDWKANKRAE